VATLKAARGAMVAVVDGDARMKQHARTDNAPLPLP
jgi:hypothetical protein